MPYHRRKYKGGIEKGVVSAYESWEMVIENGLCSINRSFPGKERRKDLMKRANVMSKGMLA